MKPTRPELTFPKDVAAFVTKSYKRAECILEYGSGGSTVLAAEMKNKTVYAVESDRDWSDNLRRYLEGSGRTRSLPLLYHADIGPTGVWGWPQGRTYAQSFHKYPLAIWNIPDFRHPDIVLIDGRFRVACFMAAVICARQPMTVLFDDYGDRPEYHSVEEFFAVKQLIGRMAVFETAPFAATPMHLMSMIQEIYNPA